MINVLSIILFYWVLNFSNKTQNKCWQLLMNSFRGSTKTCQNYFFEKNEKFEIYDSACIEMLYMNYNISTVSAFKPHTHTQPDSTFKVLSFKTSNGTASPHKTNTSPATGEDMLRISNWKKCTHRCSITANHRTWTSLLPRSLLGHDLLQQICWHIWTWTLKFI